MTVADLDKVERKILAIVDRLIKMNQPVKIKDLFKIAKRELKFPSEEIERAIWKLISKKYIVNGTKITKTVVLENKNRQEMLRLIFNKPSIHIRDIRSALNIGAYLTAWHLQILEKFGFIRKKTEKNQILVFPAHLKEEYEDVFRVLNDETVFEINEFIFERESVYLSEIIEKFKFDAKTAQSYLNVLSSVNLVSSSEKEGLVSYKGNAEQLKPVLGYWKTKDAELEALIRKPEMPPTPLPPPIETKPPETVELKREYDYLGGNIRFKIAVQNNSPTMISKIRVMLTPTDQFKFEAEVKSVETLGPGESRGIDFLLTPMTCGKSQVFGTVSYLDAFGHPTSLTVAPKEIWVKCPLVTSVKADMKELLAWQSELQSGMSSISFTGLDSKNAFDIVSSQISALDLAVVTLDDRLLKVIYSGLAKVTNTKIIVELETYPDAIKLVVWAADLKQVTGFLAYIKNLVYIALDMSKSLKVKEEKIGQQILAAFEFSERLVQLFEYCESNWALTDISILLKEIIRRKERDLPNLPLDPTSWLNIIDLASQSTQVDTLLAANATINLEYDIYTNLEKVSELVRSNLELYRAAFHDDSATTQTIETKYQQLCTNIAELEKKYSKRILAFLLIIDHTSGVNLYQHNFAGKSLDPDLISGFLTAVQSFGVELSSEKTEMKKLAYKNFEIELNIGDHVRAALFLMGQSSKWLVKTLVTFINAFEQRFGDVLKDWHGDVSKFTATPTLVKEIFNI